MSVFNRLFGKKGPLRQPFDADQFLRAVVQFVNAGTWDESRRIVERTPLLLDPRADDLLRQVAAAQPDPQVRQAVEEHRALLRRCREVGSESAFAEKTSGSDTDGNIDVPPELQIDLAGTQSASTAHRHAAARPAMPAGADTSQSG